MTTPVIFNQPCEPWEPIWCDLTAELTAVTGWAVQAATEVLWALSGRQFGSCSATLRPCRRDCYGNSWPFADNWWEFPMWPRPVLFDGAWVNIACGSCAGTCSCGPLEEAILPAPVYDVTQVMVDGVVLTEGTQWRLDNRRVLLRLDGQRWPVCQDLTQPATGTGTWQVTALYGEPVPTLGQRAVGELAHQFALACVNDDDCKLPQPVQSIVRQGVSVTFIDPNQLLADGRIGLYLSDLFIQTQNPNRLMSRARAFDVDGPDWRYPSI